MGEGSELSPSRPKPLESHCCRSEEPGRQRNPESGEADGQEDRQGPEDTSQQDALPQRVTEPHQSQKDKDSMEKSKRSVDAVRQETPECFKVAREEPIRGSRSQ